MSWQVALIFGFMTSGGREVDARGYTLIDTFRILDGRPLAKRGKGITVPLIRPQ
jgi:hypothetical protein